MVVIVVLGLLAGPVLNLLIDRLPYRHALLAAPSCSRCRRQRPWTSLLPLSSWWLGTARCPSCKATTGRRALLVNVATAVGRSRVLAS